ncbi:hypothetical protein SS50377_26888 [Spironucleus salmonicida]|uniref:Transmembrane protein n=1 Tax=Spironucleus salmonicida TaxID=348837 RepID=V6LS49_9EUKA|nr:hypothetical protein SS50377_26888 [Spironucleus salmonicida]|eukprot:EST47400.1 Hypothetical protein SS50377_12387 [Spironucleus salmonicida]
MFKDRLKDFYHFCLKIYKNKLNQTFNLIQVDLPHSIEHQIIVDCQRSLFKFKHLYKDDFQSIQEIYTQYFLDFWSFLPQHIQHSYLQGIGDVFEILFLTFAEFDQHSNYYNPVNFQKRENLESSQCNLSDFSNLSKSQTALYQAQIPINPDILIKTSVFIALSHYNESQFKISFYQNLSINTPLQSVIFSKEILDTQLLKLYITQGMHCSKSINFAFNQSKNSIQFGISHSSKLIIPIFQTAILQAEKEITDEIEGMQTLWEKFEILSFDVKLQGSYNRYLVVCYFIILGLFFSQLQTLQFE